MAVTEIIGDDTWTEVVAAGGTSNKTVSINVGRAYIRLGDDDAAMFDISATSLDDPLVVAAGTRVRIRRKSDPCIVVTGDFSGAVVTPVVPPLPDDQVTITDGDSLTVVDGDGTSATGSIAVAGNTAGDVTIPSANAIVAGGTPTLLPASGTTPAQGSLVRTVSGGVEAIRLSATRVALTTGATAAVQNSAGAAIGTGTITIAANAVSHIRLPATIAGVANASAITMQNSAGAAIAGTHTATVAAGVVSHVRLAATVAPVATGSQAVADAGGKSSTALRTVAAGAVSSVVLAATDCIVKDADTFTAVDGGSITVAVAAGVPTFTYTAP